jgi:hypothetical protein
MVDETKEIIIEQPIPTEKPSKLDEIVPIKRMYIYAVAMFFIFMIFSYSWLMLGNQKDGFQVGYATCINDIINPQQIPVADDFHFTISNSSKIYGRAELIDVLNLSYEDIQKIK